MDQRSSPAKRPRRKRGMVLLMVLVMIVVLSALMIQFTEKGVAEMSSEGHYFQRDRLRLIGYSALETTLGVLADVLAIEGNLTAPAQGWGDPLGLAGFDPGENVKVQVTFFDESGKLPLARLDQPALALLFTQMGFENADAVKLADSLLDWVDRDDEPHLEGAESDVYELAEWPYQASNRRIRKFSELGVIDGFRTLFFDEAGRPNGYYRLFVETVSLYSNNQVNANSANEVALLSLGGLGDPQLAVLRDYLAGADRIRGTEDDRYFATPQELTQLFGSLPEGVQLGVQAQILRIHVAVTEGEGQFALEAVVRAGNANERGGGGRPGRGGGQSSVIGGNASGAAGGAGGQQGANVPYPFVFLELAEDVGHNHTIAAPADPAAAEPGA